MIDTAATNRLLDENIYIRVASDPLAVAKVIGRALHRQHRGGRLSFTRILVEALAEGDPNFIVDMKRDLDRAMARS